MGRSTAVSVLLSMPLSMTAAQAPNAIVSASNMNHMKLGWQGGPSQRGTLTLVWSCLSTVVACTWTILHLNVPRGSDGALTKAVRKAKWMLTTILFPEFIFSKAVCELQMAVDDLFAMNEMGNIVGWKVDFGPGLERLHKLFHYFLRPLVPKNIGNKNQSTSANHSQKGTNDTEGPLAVKAAVYPSPNCYDPVLLPRGDRRWTLTHSYFANMGGFERCSDSGDPVPLTAHALVNCCVGTEHDPLPNLALQEKDIEDKSKADWLLRLIAVTQISWFILSVIVRGVKRLPTSQLEICTTAFALLAVATYIANWAKPKDVGTPVRFRVVADISQCQAFKYHGEPFFRRLSNPSESGKSDSRLPRIENDFVRLEGSIPPMAITMAISSLVFGGLHCLAWKYGFPTKAEMMIWMVASVASATIPTAALALNIIAVRAVHHAQRKCLRVYLDKAQSFKKDRESERALRGHLNMPPDSSQKTAGLSTRPGEGRHLELAEQLCTLHKDWVSFMNWRIRHCEVFKSYDRARGAFRSRAPNEVQREEVRQELLAVGLQMHDVDFLFYLVEDPEFARLKGKLDKVRSSHDRVSQIVTIIGGTLYAVVRIMLLALAFCALRFVPEGVYTTTWTRFIPNIS